MKVRFALLVAGAMLGTLTGCGSSESDKSTTEMPPASQPQPADSATAGYQVIQVADGGAIGGTITVSGTMPKLAPRPIKKDTNVCGTATRESQLLMVTPSGGLKNAIVMVEGVKRGKAMPTAAPQIDQNKCEYSPHVQVVPLNTEISILNSDPILHNIHFYQDDDSLFNIAQPVKGQVNKYKLEKAGMIYAECDVHAWMQGHMAVVDNPYYAVTDENGKFSIADLPPGNYTVKIWHEYLGEKTQDVTVPAKGEVALNLDLKDLLAAKNPGAATAAPAPAPAAGGEATKMAAAAPAGDAAKAAPAAGGTLTIVMQSAGGDFAYAPLSPTVKVGTVVTWVNKSDARHTATDDPKFEKKKGQAILPEGGTPWSTPFIADGQSASITFTQPGKYQYFCRNHGQFGMVGTITVVP